MAPKKKPTRKSKPKGPTVAQLQGLVIEMNEVMDLDPAIDEDLDKVADLKEAIAANAVHPESEECQIYTTDFEENEEDPEAPYFSAEAKKLFAALDIVPVDPPDEVEEPEPEKEEPPAKPKKPAAKKGGGTAKKPPAKPAAKKDPFEKPTATTLIMMSVVEDESRDIDALEEILNDAGFSTSRSTISIQRADTMKTLAYLRKIKRLK